MFWIALFAAAQMAGPGLADALNVFSPDDMPADVQIAGINRLILTRTTIRPDGTAQDCVLERSGGDPQLDVLTCAIIVERAKFQRATWVDGSPAYAVIRAPVSWAIGGSPSKDERRKAFPADMHVSVKRLPNHVKTGTKVQLVVAVDEKGQVVSCGEGPQALEAEHKKRMPELVPIACEQMSKYTAISAKDASGQPVKSVQNASVEFSIGL